MEKQKNELMIINQMEKKLQQPRIPEVYPLMAMHRKELRVLKKKNLGNLRDQLNNIKILKREEYVKKYSALIQKEITANKETCKKLNDDWDTRLKKIRYLLEGRAKLEKQLDITRLDLNMGYNDVAKLLVSDTDMHRTFKFNLNEVSKKIAIEEFDKKFGMPFQKISEKIDDLETKYEEAINFGDLEIVKQLYYMMKKSDKFFDKINALEV